MCRCARRGARGIKTAFLAKVARNIPRASRSVIYISVAVARGEVIARYKRAIKSQACYGKMLTPVTTRGRVHRGSAFQYVLKRIIAARSCSTPHVDQLRVWPSPGNEPLVDVDRTIVITVHHQATVLTVIRSLPQWHVLLLLAHMTRLGGIAFTYNMQFFPIQ